MTASDDDIQKEIASWNDDKITSIEDVNSSKTHDLETIKNNLLDQKVRDFIIDSAKIK